MHLFILIIVVVLLSFYVAGITKCVDCLETLEIVTNDLASTKIDQSILNSTITFWTPSSSLVSIKVENDDKFILSSSTQQSKESTDSVSPPTALNLTTTTTQPSSDYEFEVTTESPSIYHRKLQVDGFSPVYLPTRKEAHNWASRAAKLIKDSSKFYKVTNKRRRGGQKITRHLRT